MVFFQSPTITSAIDLVKGIIGLNGIGLPQALLIIWDRWLRDCVPEWLPNPGAFKISGRQRFEFQS
jgi:hypothetical protein